jgi:hypothetical protein
MAKVKSIITEADVTFLKDVDVEYVSLVGHAANRQPFKIIKGEVRGDKVMRKQTIYNVLIKKGVTEEKLQELANEHKFSVDQKDETALEGYDVYNQIEEDEIDPDTKKMAAITDDVYAIVADLKEESKVDGIEKEELEYETMEKVADSLFAMMDIVLGTMRQPDAENRKEMITSAVTNFSNYVDVALSTMKKEDVLEDFEIKSEIIKEYFSKENEEEIDFDTFTQEIEATLKTKFETLFEEKLTEVKGEISEIKDNLNTSLNEQFELYTKKEDVEKEMATVKTELKDLKNTTKKRNSEINEEVSKPKNTIKRESKPGQFKTFV